MIKYFSKLYIPEKYIAICRDRNFENETPLMSYDIMELIKMIKKNHLNSDFKYIEIELYNLNADDTIPFHTFCTQDQVLELRKHAKLRRLFFSPTFSKLYGESFYIDSNSINIKIDYSYIYGKWINKFKDGDIVSTSILRDETIPGTNNKKYGKVKLRIIFTKTCVMLSDMVCGFTFEIISNDESTELYCSDYRPVIPVSTLKKIEGE